MKLVPFSICLVLLLQAGFANDSKWLIPYSSSGVLVDGFLTDWQGLPAIELDPAATGVTLPIFRTETWSPLFAASSI